MKKIKERDEKMAEEDNDNKLPHEVPKSLSPKIQFFIAILIGICHQPIKGGKTRPTFIGS